MKKNLFYLIVFVSTQHWLAGCNVSKNLSLPVKDIPGKYRYPQTDSITIAEIPFQTFFQDATLQHLIAVALQNNFDFQNALKNIEAARLVLRQAKQGNVPVLDLQANAVYSQPSENSLNGHTLNQFSGAAHIEDYSLSAALSWEADVWGKIKNRTASALAAYLQTTEARNAIQTRLISDVAKGYYNLLELDAALGIARKNISLIDSTIQIIQWQFNAGQVTSLALQQTQAQQLIAKALVPQFEQTIAIQENALSLLCGKQPGIITRDVTIEAITVRDNLNAGLPLALLSHRPDVKSAVLSFDIANAEAGYAKANLYPSLVITARGGLDAIQFNNWLNIPASLFGIIAGGLTQPLFKHKVLQTQYKTAIIARDQTVIRFRQSVLTAVTEVTDAIVTIDKLGQQQAFVKKRLDTLELAIQNARMLFNNGLASYLEVITAQTNVLQAELEVVSIKNARLAANADLYRALGGGVN